jgi:hypothetical protein
MTRAISALNTRSQVGQEASPSMVWVKPFLLLGESSSP